MALWPFRRKGSRRRSVTTPMISDVDVSRRGRQDRHPLRAQTDSPKATNTTIAGPSGGKRDRHNKLQRRARNYSFSPGRRDSLRYIKPRRETVPALAPGLIIASAEEVHGSQGAAFAPNDDFASRVPTLHHNVSGNKRRGQPLPRKKSSKRRKEDHDREAEIKAMSQFMPVRPATDSWTAGRPTKKDSRRFKTGLNRSFDDPTSEISLPMPESIHSYMSSDSERLSWKVSTLNALAPRPTLRCSSNPIYGPAIGPGPARSLSTRRRIAERGTIAEETLKAHKRVDDLADDLDASDLRELMERDRRRREQKKERERERIERRLTRRAEKQRVEQAEAVKSGTPPPQNLERGVLGREMIGEGSDPASAIVTSSRRRPSSDSARKQDKQKAHAEETGKRDRSSSPLDEFHRTDSIQNEPSILSRPHEPEPEPEPAPEEPPSRRSSSPRILNFIRSRKSRSKSPKQSNQERTDSHAQSPVPTKPEDAESGGRISDSGSSRPWTSFFRWGKRRRSSGPSSFSNTSRDSMLGGPPPQSVNYIPSQRLSASVPKRTMSRFREDLPELPLSPPDSRVASPDDEPMLVEPLPIIPDDVQMRYDTPTSGHRSQEAMRATPISWHRDEVQPSPAPQSMSLASIDSEASWLSGRISRKRASSGMRNSLQHYSQPAVYGGSDGRVSEDDNVAEDEYSSSVVPTQLHHKSAVEGRPSSDEDDSEPEAKWGAVGQIPTVMHHRDTMRSREGILQSFDDEEEEYEKDSEIEEEGHSPVEPQRATSVNLGKGHLRNFSAGSAKLLEISPRASGENRRSVIERGTQ
ncbi:hypothetical protein F4779DRAFT_471520 [Xylariaceae sp. FL0662B]|nr:hypothetical protein F4779DRAFT_471520 [Xylariaceae sp. FL0662B]